MKRMLYGTLAAITLAGGAGAQDLGAPVSLGPLTMTNVYAQATPPSAPVGGGYLTVTNSAGPDRLIGVTASTITDQAEIHEMRMAGDVMQMRSLPEGVEVPAGGTLVLKPGALHLMFMNLRAPLVAGETVPVTLEFEKAGKVTLPMAVVARGAKTPDHPQAKTEGEHAGH